MVPRHEVKVPVLFLRKSDKCERTWEKHIKLFERPTTNGKLLGKRLLEAEPIHFVSVKGILLVLLSNNALLGGLCLSRAMLSTRSFTGYIHTKRNVVKILFKAVNGDIWVKIIYLFRSVVLKIC